MDNSIYVTLSRQMALFRDMDVTANNIANANTTGYNADHIQFDSYVVQDMSQGQRNPMAFANNIGTYRDMRGGQLQVTGNELDVAIEGNGYFTIETPLGTRYTRSGHFRLDGGGTLVTTEGYPVLDASGQHIELPENTTSVQIGELGNIKVNGDDFGSLGVVQFDHPQLLERLGGSLYKSEVTPQPAQDFHVAQKMLESSNVQPVVELTHMVTVSHSVTDTAQMVSALYDLERKTADAWAQQA